MKDTQGTLNPADRTPSRFELALAVILVVAALVPLAVPYVRQGHQIAHDRLVPYLRVDALYRAIREPQIPPRWFPDFDGGYGSPYPSFYAMLFYYPATALFALGLPLGSAVELTAFAALVLPGFTMFFFVTRYWGAASGLLAAVLYVYAPYHLTDAFERGAYSELAAFVWPPLIALSYLACLGSSGKRWVLLGGISTAALILTHNLTSLIFFPPLVLLLIAWVGGSDIQLAGVKQGLRRLALAAALGLSLSAFFWGPLVLERDFVRLEYFLSFDYRGDYVGVGQLLGLPVDSNMATSIGLPLAILPVLAIALAVVTKRANREQIGLLVGLLALGWTNVFMATRFSAPVWQLFTPLQFVQFPWRFLLPASFYLAAAAGPLARVLGGTRVSWTSATVLGMASVFMFAPLAQISRRATVLSVEPSDTCREVWGTQDYRPAWSQVAFWRGDRPPSDPSASPVLKPCPDSALHEPANQVELLEIEQTGREWIMTVRAREDTTVKVSHYYYPGWEATIDGISVPVQPTAPEGLIGVTIPPGTHTVILRLAETATRTTSNLVSLISMPVTAWLIIARRSGRSRSGRPSEVLGDTAPS